MPATIRKPDGKQPQETELLSGRVAGSNPEKARRKTTGELFDKQRK
jgi:hypothetical protein